MQVTVGNFKVADLIYLCCAKQRDLMLFVHGLQTAKPRTLSNVATNSF